MYSPVCYKSSEINLFVMFQFTFSDMVPPPLFFGNLVVETLLCGGRNMAVNGNVSFRGEGLNNLVLTCSEVNINPFAFVSNV